MGFFDSLSRGWTFMRQSFAMAKEEPRLLKPSIFSVLAGIVYFIVWGVIFVASGVDPDSGAAWTLGAIATFGSFCIFYFFCGMTVNMVDAHLEGNQPNLGDAYRDAKQNMGALCALAVVSTIVNLLSQAARGRGNRGGLAIVGRIVASIIETVWTVVSFLLLPAIIIENLSLRQALGRVRELHGGHKLLVGVGEVGVRMVTGLIGVVVILLIFAMAYTGFAVLGGTVGSLLAFIVGGGLLACFAAFSTYLRMSYYTCLYLWALQSEREGAEAPAPLPLAVALGRPARERGPIAA